jgi:hypothetical protein
LYFVHFGVAYRDKKLSALSLRFRAPIQVSLVQARAFVIYTFMSLLLTTSAELALSSFYDKVIGRAGCSAPAAYPRCGQRPLCAHVQRMVLRFVVIKPVLADDRVLYTKGSMTRRWSLLRAYVSC